MTQRHTVKVSNPLAIWLLIALVLLCAIIITGVIFVIAPAQQSSRQAQATATAQAFLLTVEAQQAQATADAQQAEVQATAAARQAEIEQHYAAGLTFVRAGDWQSAADAFRQVIALQADYRDAPAQLAAMLNQLEVRQATATAQIVAMAARSRADADATATTTAQQAADALARQQATATAAAGATAQALAQRYARAQGLINLARWPEAEAELQAIFDIQPDYQQVQSLLATASAETAKLGPTRTPSVTPTPTFSPTPSATLRPSPTPQPPTPTTDVTATALAVLHATQTAAAGSPPTPRPPTLTPDRTATAAFATAEALRNRPTWTATPTPSHTPTPNLTATAALAIAQAVGTVEALGLDPAGVRINPLDGALYLRVPAGPFIMGSDTGAADERPVHEVTLDEFWIKRTEVTNAEYARCVTAGVCTAPSNNRWQDSRYAEHPVVNVSWDRGASAYASWVGGRLPTEAEWEKACRGTDQRQYPWGNETPDAMRANFANSLGDTTAVGSYPAGVSPYGALDMAGNVQEWTADWYDAGYYNQSPASNPTGPASGQYRVLRGGSYGTGAAGVGCSARSGNYTEFRDRGFRVVSSPSAVGR